MVFFKRLAEIASEYLKKGSLVYVEGKLKTRKWQDQNGQNRYSTEIVANEMQMLGGRQNGEFKKPNYDENQPTSNSNSPAVNPKIVAPDGFNDDIPF